MIKLHTSMGVISIELDHEKAPLSAANFQQYATDGFFDGTIFHRVIPGFMVQGGGMLPGMKQKPTGDEIKNEGTNGLKNDRGTLAMARTSDPHSATAQFFFNVVDNAFLNHRQPSGDGWGYAVFGKVTDGMDVIDAIIKVPTGSQAGHQDVPNEDILIERVEVVAD